MATEITDAVWRIEQGERETLAFPVLDDDDDPFPIGGWSVDAKIKTRPGGDTLHTFPAADITIASNQITLRIPAATSAAWTFTSGWFRVVIADDDPDDQQKFRVLSGTFVVDPD
jgi:hypothetical protein